MTQSLCFQYIRVSPKSNEATGCTTSTFFKLTSQLTGYVTKNVPEIRNFSKYLSNLFGAFFQSMDIFPRMTFPFLPIHACLNGFFRLK